MFPRFAVCAALALSLCAPLRGEEASEPTETTQPAAKENHVMVTIKTSMGDIKLDLDAEKAPDTVANFIQYANDGHYNGTVFHRVIANFMIQGGGMTPDMRQKPTRTPIRNEAANGLKNQRGTIAMARTSDVNSATSQFFINVVDNAFLDYKSATPQGFGYCVFGRVVEGMEVVDKIRGVRTSNRGGHGDVPVEPVLIQEVVVEAAE